MLQIWIAVGLYNEHQVNLEKGENPILAKKQTVSSYI